VSLLDTTVDTAIQNNTGLVFLRPVVEKEILHHDILREMNKCGYLKQLTFIGGTCLRCCHNSPRLSEDLDFTGGFEFTRETMTGLGEAIKGSLERKYELPVSVTEPVKETGNTDTWKIRLTTHPERPDLPAQHIHIDVCALPSRDRKAMLVRNHYGLEMGTNGLMLYAESLPEILCDKLQAFAYRKGRVKNRDLWDIFWFANKNVQLDSALFLQKLSDRNIDIADLKIKFQERLLEIKEGQSTFLHEMRRFLSPDVFTEEFTSPIWWEGLQGILEGYIAW
jgi:predicted nucleotidyltransferase component of viral defense system